MVGTSPFEDLMALNESTIPFIEEHQILLLEVHFFFQSLFLLFHGVTLANYLSAFGFTFLPKFIVEQ